MNKREIVILGCGLSGMITGLGLANCGIKVAIIEKNSVTNTEYFDNRTTAITQNSKLTFKNFNIWDSIIAKIGNIAEVYVVDNKSPTMLHFDAKKHKLDSIGYMIQNRDLHEELTELVRKNPLIEIIDNTSYIAVDSTPNSTKICLSNGDSLKCDLLIVCDGCNSLVRECYFSDFVNKEYNQSAITFNVEHEKPHEGTAVEHFMTNGPFAILPLRDQYISSIVWVENDEVAKLYTQMDNETLTKYVQMKFGEFLGNVKIISTPFLHKLKARIARNYYYNNLILVGESAHVIHPLAGQGLNQTIKDINSLVNVIYSRKSLGLEITGKELKLYQRARFIDNYIMYLITDNLNKLFSNNLPILSQMRKVGMKLLDKSCTVKRLIVGYAMGDRFGFGNN